MFIMSIPLIAQPHKQLHWHCSGGQSGVGLEIKTGTERREEITDHLSAKNITLLSEPGCSRKADVNGGMHKDGERKVTKGRSTPGCH